MDDRETVSSRTVKSRKKALDSIAKGLERDRSFVINEAISNYIELHKWQLSQLEQGIKQADRGDFASQAEVNAVFKRFKK